MIRAKAITLREYESIDRDDKLFTHQYAKDLQKFLTSIGLKEPLMIGVSTITAKHYVGTISFNGITIEILPKLLSGQTDFSEELRTIEKERMMKSLLAMLSYTFRLKIKPNDIAHFDFKKDYLLDVFIHLYCSQLYKGLVREAPHRYEKIKSNQGFVRGKIKFKEHLKINSVNKSKVFCEYSNFQRDNILNQTFLCVSKKILSIAKSQETKLIICNIIKLLEGITSKDVTYNQVRAKEVGRSYKHLEQSFNFCKMFLKNNSPTLLAGGHHNFCILFNMNDVFEEFVFEFLLRNKENISSDILRVEFQRGRKLFSGWEDLEAKTSSSKEIKSIQNDIRVIFKNGPALIIDTKYKILNDPTKIATADSFQMFMYSHLEREIEEQQPEIALLFPEDSKSIHYKFPFKGNKTSLRVHTIPLELSSISHIEEFCNKLKTIINDFRTIK